MITPIFNDADIDSLRSVDSIFDQIIGDIGPPFSWSRPPGFTSLCKIILEQQVSLDSARACYDRLDTYVGGMSPSRLLKLYAVAWRTFHVSRQKARYLSVLSAATFEGSLDFDAIAGQSNELVSESLESINGMGRWTSNVYLLFCLQRKDVFPPGDIAVINKLAKMRGIDKSAIAATSE